MPVMVLDALGNIATRLESQKNRWNRDSASLYLRDWLEPVSTRPQDDLVDPWNEGSKVCSLVDNDNTVNNRMGRTESPVSGTSEQLRLAIVKTELLGNARCLFRCPKRQDSGTFWSAVEGYESLCQPGLTWFVSLDEGVCHS
jgi:hypothetical protein